MTAADERDERAPLLDQQHEVRVAADTEIATETTPLKTSDSEDGDSFRWKPLVAILFIGVVQPMCFELIFPFISA